MMDSGTRIFPCKRMDLREMASVFSVYDDGFKMGYWQDTLTLSLRKKGSVLTFVLFNQRNLSPCSVDMFSKSEQEQHSAELSSKTHLPPLSSPTVLRLLCCRDDGCEGGSPNSHHRRAHSEVSFRLPEDMMDLSPFDPFTGGSSIASLEEIESEDDLFSTYVEKLSSGGGALNVSVHAETSGKNEEDESLGGSGSGGTGGERPRHRHRNRRRYVLIC
ncbi:hypothetical protein PIB30_054831 [Stylosanthes scabra]|uniref:Uncharacterized protein n=1 Tax=Stylosanthes scabra TaxID=79078 RepID=A0ABU6QIQ6_9FABA|nr:hypothetical protein [Stylosanthes scabra]